MSLALQPLPEDPDALRRFAADLQAELARKDIEITARDAEIHAKTLHIEKLKMQLAVLRRARFGRSCETIVQAPMPSLPIERGLPGPGLLAHIAISKFCDHQPLHRQSEMYAREGIELDRALMADWMGKVVFLLTPLAEAIGRHIRAGEVLHADDTTVPVLSPGQGRTATGRQWGMVRDERPWGSTVPPAVLYRYSPNHKGLHAQA